MSLTQYLLEFSLCLALFYGLYHFLLRKETYFQLNRWYLLLSPVLSMIIPFLDWQLPAEPTQSNWDQIMVPLVTDIQQQQMIMWENLGRPADPVSSFTYLDLLLIIYLLGMLWMCGRLLYRTWRVMKLIGQGEQQQEQGYTVVKHQGKVPAASFLSYVFWEEGPLNPERKKILEHELVHVRQWHSLDVLLMEVWVMLKWFHPLIYWYRNSLRLTHEYIADAYVSGMTGNRLEYAELLTRTQPVTVSHQLLHHFNSSIKMRLLMLAKNQSSKWKYLKLLAIIPATALLMVLFAFNLSGELPDPIVAPLEKIERGINDMAHRPVLPQASTSRPLPVSAKEYVLKWGDIECICRNEQFPNYYHCENQSLRPRELKRLVRKEGGFQVYLEGQEQSINELKAISKYMKDMGGYQGQFDEMDQDFNTESPLWKQAEKGDVFRFSFNNGSGDYFEFDVVINNRQEEFVFGSRVELGDYQFNINLTSDRGVAHMDVEDLKRLAKAPLRIMKNNDDYYALKSASISNREALRQDDWSTIRGEALDISRSKAILEAFPGDRVGFSLESEDGEKIEFDVILWKNSSWDGRKREQGVQWGDQYFDSSKVGMITKSELKALMNEDMYLIANGEKIPMKDRTVESHAITMVGNIPQEKKIQTHGVKDYLEKNMDKLEPGRSLNLSWLKTVDGYLTPHMFLYLDYEWKEIFADNPNAKVLGDNTLIIEPATEEDLQKLISLEKFPSYLYEIQIDNQKIEPNYLFRLEGRKPEIEQAVEDQQTVKKKIVIKRGLVNRDIN